MPADILIYAIVAAGLVFWLRNILGTRSGDERERPNPFASSTPRPEQLSGRPAPELAAAGTAPLLPGQAEGFAAALDRNMGIDGEEAERGLGEIVRADRSFDLRHFLSGAQDAFVMIVESFAKGEKETLENLLAPSVYAAFARVIDERAEKGEKAEVEIHAVRRTEVVAAGVRGKDIVITLRFTADETSIVRDADDRVIFGNPDRVTETIDLWTFTRPVRSGRDAWRICETREAPDDELPGSTVPGTV